MLGVGFGVAEEPLLRGLAENGDQTAYRAAVARGTLFFNSHPYLAGLAVGAAARLEYERAPGPQIERLRAALCGPLGSLGDRLVWAGLLPFASAVAISAIALGAGGTAIAAFLLLYNTGHLALRWWALRAGWSHGAAVASALRNPTIQRLLGMSAPAMGLATGFALPVVARSFALPFPAWARLVVSGSALLTLVVLRLFPSRVSGLRIGLAVVALALIGGWVWWR
jgi:PTS system mannose-specific IID component